MASTDGAGVVDAEFPVHDNNSPKSTKFRFKKRSRSAEQSESHPHSKRQRVHRRDHDRDSRHRRRDRGKAHKFSSTGIPDDPSLYDDIFAANTRSSQYLDPDQAFRESLFDALADDEGAAYWEGVYGQPIHTYPYPASKPGPDGELERMNEDEYAEYVRSKMWEKTHQHVIEERERRENARQRQKAWQEQTRRMEDDRDAFERQVEESLQRGERRKKAKRLREAWVKYCQGWEELKDRIARRGGETEGKRVPTRDLIPWPVETGGWKDVEKEDVESFLRDAPPPELDQTALLKAERVRWHPDKMQQRFGGQQLDADAMKSVTAVFQVIDRMWTEAKDKQ
ncbi:hypothetical protein W97_03581 [Coniosporium apollinis CBS 100218]|uniref:J domain-containing protein n=1 Tax=Coniosporium apollinis (strain CBS 100218) TaxID=1168221 RepID=R7YQZ7_CONA1|nr:uncharacterized protein W97_03581 [Coniosporium apollinis CBS 100218]EON64350.1 hypothetical protein W97_03581 [Coniosporium apollinis CBS 100218]